MSNPIRFKYLGEDSSPPCVVTTSIAMPRSVFMRACFGFLRIQRSRLADEAGDRRAELLRVIEHLEAAIRGEDGHVGQRIVDVHGSAHGDLVAFDAPKMSDEDKKPMIIVPSNYPSGRTEGTR